MKSKIVALILLMVLCPTAWSRDLSNHEASQELAQMYEQDQSDRINKKGAPLTNPEDLKSICENDKKRRKRVLELLKKEKLKSANDYYHAAMIMQHGDKPSEYALAHVLATAAAIRGHKKAIWLCAASFDRLMVNIEQPQIFGTQFHKEGNKPYIIQDPKDLSLIPDSLRLVFNVPPQKEAKKRLKNLNKN